MTNIDLLPPEAHLRGVQLRRAVPPGLAVCVALALVALQALGGAVLIAPEAPEVARWEDGVARVQAQLDGLHAELERLESRDAWLAALASMRRLQEREISRIERVAELLPDSVWLDTVEIDVAARSFRAAGIATRRDDVGLLLQRLTEDRECRKVEMALADPDPDSELTFSLRVAGQSEGL